MSAFTPAVVDRSLSASPVCWNGKEAEPTGGAIGAISGAETPLRPSGQENRTTALRGPSG